MNDLCSIELKLGKRDISFKMELNQIDAAHISNGQMYEPQMSTLFSEILKPGDVAIDVGANVGWFTILAASLVGPNGRVYSFEPAPENQDSLSRHVEINDLKNIEIIKAAASDVSGESNLFLNPYGNGGHSFYNMQEGRADLKQPTIIKVNKVALDEYFESIDLSKLGLIKIDTEGHDVRVLAGASMLIQDYQPPYIFTELHGGIRKFNDTQLGLFSMMREHGYSAFLLLNDFPMPIFIPHGTQIKSKHALNLLFASPEDIGRLFPIMNIDFEENHNVAT